MASPAKKLVTSNYIQRFQKPGTSVFAKSSQPKKDQDKTLAARQPPAQKGVGLRSKMSYDYYSVSATGSGLQGALNSASKDPKARASMVMGGSKPNIQQVPSHMGGTNSVVSSQTSKPGIET